MVSDGCAFPYSRNRPQPTEKESSRMIAKDRMLGRFSLVDLGSESESNVRIEGVWPDANLEKKVGFW